MVDGRNAAGRVNSVADVPLLTAPSKWTIPPIVRTPALRMEKSLTQPFFSGRTVKLVVSYAKETPSSEVKHCASPNVPSGSTSILPS